METPTQEPSAKPTARIAWGLLSIALVAPVLMSAAGLITAFKAGEFTFQVGFAWLIAVIVIDLILRKRAPVIKARGRIAAAMLALIMGLTVGIGEYRDAQKVNTAKQELIEQFMTSTVEAKNRAAQPIPPETASSPLPQPAPKQAIAALSIGNEADHAVALLNAMKPHIKKLSEDLTALEHQFNANDLGSVLAAKNLVSLEGIQASRKKVENFRALIQQRGIIFQQYFTNVESLFKNSGMSQRETADGLAGVEKGKRNTLKLYQELDTAQLESLKTLSSVLNLAEQNLGRITVQNGQLIFQSQVALDEYQVLLQTLTESSAHENKVTEQIQAMAQQQKQNLVDEYKK